MYLYLYCFIVNVVIYTLNLLVYEKKYILSVLAVDIIQ